MADSVLIGQVKSKLNITWEDEDTNKRIVEIIDSAIPDVIDMLGIADADFDFSSEGKEHDIFLNRCFYEWNHALEEFEANYSKMIARIRAKHEVDQYLADGEVVADAEQE